jgi:NADH:ubiquinone oxidoreductase subunit 5 (subunit L)/multisubunit Na+/H+ antiporter MnhA subunit
MKIARCSPLFEYPPNALIVITFVGAMTSFFAATTGKLFVLVIFLLTIYSPLVGTPFTHHN